MAAPEIKNEAQYKLELARSFKIAGVVMSPRNPVFLSGEALKALLAGSDANAVKSYDEYVKPPIGA